MELNNSFCYSLFSLILFFLLSFFFLILSSKKKKRRRRRKRRRKRIIAMMTKKWWHEYEHINKYKLKHKGYKDRSAYTSDDQLPNNAENRKNTICFFLFSASHSYSNCKWPWLSYAQSFFYGKSPRRRTERRACQSSLSVFTPRGKAHLLSNEYKISLRAMVWERKEYNKKKEENTIIFNQHVAVSI
jgi:hypothetical protein